MYNNLISIPLNRQRFISNDVDDGTTINGGIIITPSPDHHNNKFKSDTFLHDYRIASNPTFPPDKKATVININCKMTNETRHRRGHCSIHVCFDLHAGHVVDITHATSVCEHTDRSQLKR